MGGHGCQEVLPGEQLLVVTGCDSGVGLWVAGAALSWGYEVLACCMNATGDGGRHLAANGAKVLEFDITKKKDIDSLTDAVQAIQETQNGSVTSLINNAGVLSIAPLEWHKPDHVTTQLRVNLEGLVLTTLALMPYIRRNKGRIINVSSPQGMVATPELSVYCASKWGVEGFTAALRRECIKWGVSVVTVRPCNIPHKTGILRGNAKLLSEMKASLHPMTQKDQGSDVDRSLAAYQAAFDNADQNNFDPTPADPHLMECFKKALTSAHPRYHYTAAPVLVRTYLALVQLLPSAVVDWLLHCGIHNTVLNWARL